mmetsp:Transcript_6330/g.14576  ORF Transcript_6330/g.14576 Transcript_6330/m.14576 type:complete len:92 (-) Transcript_6330:94-369(-)
MGIPERRSNFVPSAPPQKASFVHLRVSDQHGREVYFKMRRKCPFGLLIEVYCQKVSEGGRPTFLYQNKQVGPGQTPDELNMEETDYLHVVD